MFHFDMQFSITRQKITHARPLLTWEKKNSRVKYLDGQAFFLYSLKVLLPKPIENKFFRKV